MLPGAVPAAQSYWLRHRRMGAGRANPGVWTHGHGLSGTSTLPGAPGAQAAAR